MKFIEAHNLGTASQDAKPKVLILLAAYNGASWIGEQIQSILRQTHVRPHIFIQDDGSSDSTATVAARLADSDSRVQVNRSTSSSGSASQNFFSLIRSHDAADYDFIALSDQDDVWNRDKLHNAVTLLISKKSAGYSSSVTAVWPSGKTRLLSQKDTVTESDFLFEGAGQGCTFVISRQFYAELRIFLSAHEPLTQGLHFHDWTIYALARSWGRTWAFDTRSTMQYRQHSQNDTGARASVSGIFMRASRIRSGWYEQQLLNISTLCRAASTDSPIINRWHALMRSEKSLQRRLSIAQFLVRGGRRKRLDNVVLVFSALVGWI
jgi:rhamnosyltransferase